MVTRNATVSDDMSKAIVDALYRHHVWRKFKFLELNGAIAALVFRFRDDLRTEFACDVGFLTTTFVGGLGATQPASNHHPLRVGTLLAVIDFAFMFTDRCTITLYALSSLKIMLAYFRTPTWVASGALSSVLAN